MIKMLALLMLIAFTAEAETSEFQQVLGGPDMDRGVFVSPTSDGGYIVVGVTESQGKGGEDVYLVKTDSAGETEWTKTFGGPDQDNGWVVHEIDGGYVVGGYTKSLGVGGFDVYLLATDTEGELQWSRTYGGETDDRCWSLLPTADGGYLLVGETVDAESGTEDGFVIKTDASGEEEWSRTFGTPAKDVGHGVDRTADGNYLVTGYTLSEPTTRDNPYLIKIDATGDTLWTRVIALDGITRAITGEQAADGGVYLVGFKHVPADGSGAALLVRTDQDGRLEWTREFLPVGRGGQSFGYTVRATPDSGCVFTGHTTAGAAGALDLFLIKVGSPARER